MSLQATNISFSYGSRFSLEHAALRADDGEFVGLIGSNGSGKTTLLKIVCALLPHSGGTVRLDGELLESYSPNRRARRIAYAPQSYKPTFEFTVEQTVLLGRMPYRGSYGGFETDEDIAVAEEAIELLELESLRLTPITQLSGGELQRVMIARTIAQGTRTIALDEPNSHLDMAHQQSVMTTLRRMTRKRSICVVASIHDLNLASMYCDSLVAMVDGRTLTQGSPEDVLTEEVLSKLYGADLVVESESYGRAPAVMFRYREDGDD